MTFTRRHPSRLIARLTAAAAVLAAPLLESPAAADGHTPADWEAECQVGGGEFWVEGKNWICEYPMEQAPGPADPATDEICVYHYGEGHRYHPESESCAPPGCYDRMFRPKDYGGEWACVLPGIWHEDPSAECGEGEMGIDHEIDGWTEYDLDGRLIHDRPTRTVTVCVPDPCDPSDGWVRLPDPWGCFRCEGSDYTEIVDGDDWGCIAVCPDGQPAAEISAGGNDTAYWWAIEGFLHDTFTEFAGKLYGCPLVDAAAGPEAYAAAQTTAPQIGDAACPNTDGIETAC